jgi:hypothetical protein
LINQLQAELARYRRRAPPAGREQSLAALRW